MICWTGKVDELIFNLKLNLTEWRCATKIRCVCGTNGAFCIFTLQPPFFAYFMHINYNCSHFWGCLFHSLTFVGEVGDSKWVTVGCSAASGCLQVWGVIWKLLQHERTVAFTGLFGFAFIFLWRHFNVINIVHVKSQTCVNTKQCRKLPG